MRWYTALFCAWALPGLGLAWLHGQDLATIQRQVVDLAALVGLPGTSGMVSGLGVGLWYVSGAVCLFASQITADEPCASGLRQAGWLSLALALDDHFMLHEEVLPRWLGFSPSVTQPLVYSCYGAVLLSSLRRFSGLWSQSESKNLLVALACLAASVAIDVLKDGEYLSSRSRLSLDPGYAMWLEESLKLLGIVAWCLFWWRWSARISKSGNWSDSASSPPPD